MNYQPVVAGNQPNSSAGIQEHFNAGKAREGNVQQYVLFPLCSIGSKDPQNTDVDTTFEVKEPESEVRVSPSSSATTKEHDDKTRKEAKGKNMPALEDITYSDDEEDVGAKANFSNLETNITVSLIPITRVHKDHPVTQIIGDLSSATQTRSMTRMVKDQVDLPKGKRAIGLKWVFRNKKDERGIVIRNKSQLVAQGHTQEEAIDYEEVFAPVARIEAIRLFLAYASFMGFMVYQMDIKSALLYGTIKEEVYVCQTPRFEDPDYPDKVYVDDIIFRSTNKDLCKAFEKLMKDKFQISSMGELTFFLGLQVKQKPVGIFISQDKYVAKILRKFGLTNGKSASTPIDTGKPLLKDSDGEDVDVHTYRLMIGPLMYLTSSRLDIMYLKCKPHLGLWYPKDSPFNLVAYSNSDYARASLDMKSTTGGYQFLDCRLISWQCKKQTIVATSSNKAEYVDVASCSAQMLLIQNQLLDYGSYLMLLRDIFFGLFYLGFGLTMQVNKSSMMLLDWTLHVTNVSSAG
nr:hypothetical protein [Tanacetum cinerariifolium]